MSKHIGKPLNKRELRELLRLVTWGASDIRSKAIPAHHKCFLYESQFMCLQMIESAPDVIRLEMKKAKATMQAHGTTHPDNAE